MRCLCRSSGTRFLFSWLTFSSLSFASLHSSLAGGNFILACISPQTRIHGGPHGEALHSRFLFGHMVVAASFYVIPTNV